MIADNQGIVNVLCKNENERLIIAIMFITRLAYISFLCVSLLLSINVQAHPHSWIDIKTVVVGDANNITGFDMSWTFDTVTSAYMVDGKDFSKETDESKALAFQKIADSVMNNLTLQHYFTYFYDDDKPVKFTVSQGGSLSQHKLKFTLKFFLPLSKPHPINANPLKLMVFEPSYYVQMSWLKEQDITLSPALAKQCSLNLVEPNPTSKQLAYAMSKPPDDIPDNELGELFSQRVLIQCSHHKG